MNRCPLLAWYLGLELIAVAAAMDSGDYWREPTLAEQRSFEPPDVADPAFWD